MRRYAAWYPAGTTLDDPPLVLHDDSAAVAPGWVLRNLTGTDMPPFIISTGKTPGVPGGYVTQVDVDIRQIVLPVLVQAADDEALADRRAALFSTMDPRRGPGTLVMASRIGLPTGQMRRVSALYSRGLEGDGMNIGGDWWRFSATFQIVDPFAYSIDDVTASWAGKTGVPRFPWSFPWSFSPGGVDVVEALDLGGDTETWPDWVIDPPFLRVKAINDRSGEWWEIRRTTDDRWVPLTVSSNTSEVRDAAGVNRYGWLTSGSDLFALLPGDTVSVQVNGGSAAFRLGLTAGEAWQALL